MSFVLCEVVFLTGWGELFVASVGKEVLSLVAMTVRRPPLPSIPLPQSLHPLSSKGRTDVARRERRRDAPRLVAERREREERKREQRAGGGARGAEQEREQQAAGLAV